MSIQATGRRVDFPTLIRALLASLLLAAAAPAAGQLHPIMLDGEAFIRASTAPVPEGDRRIDFVRENETSIAWTKLVSFRRQQLPQLGNDPVQVAKAMMKLVKAANEKAQARLIVNDENTEAVLDFLSWPPDAKYMEFNVLRYARASDGNAVVALQFAHRFNDPKAKDTAERFRTLRRAWIRQAVNFDMGLVQATMAP